MKVNSRVSRPVRLGKTERTFFYSRAVRGYLVQPQGSSKFSDIVQGVDAMGPLFGIRVSHTPFKNFTGP